MIYKGQNNVDPKKEGKRKRCTKFSTNNMPAFNVESINWCNGKGAAQMSRGKQSVT